MTWVLYCIVKLCHACRLLPVVSGVKVFHTCRLLPLVAGMRLFCWCRWSFRRCSVRLPRCSCLDLYGDAPASSTIRKLLLNTVPWNPPVKSTEFVLRVFCISLSFLEKLIRKANLHENWNMQTLFQSLFEYFCQISTKSIIMIRSVPFRSWCIFWDTVYKPTELLCVRYRHSCFRMILCFIMWTV